MSNMRQLGVAISMYTGDYRGVLPHSDDKSPVDKSKLDKAGCWFYAVDPYLLNRAVSSSVDLQQKTAPFKQDPIWKTFDVALRSDWHTIKMNRKLIGRKGDWNYNQEHTADADPNYRTTITVDEMVNTVLLFDGRCEEGSAFEKERYDGWETHAARRHSGGANVLFVDGHGEWRMEKLQKTGKKTGWQNDDTSLQWWATKL
jgi:prepilin-type processing-associated H-X9-DG protein